MVSWKHRIKRNLVSALVSGLVANVVYFGLLFTRTFHGFAVGMLGAAIIIVNRYIDTTYSAGLYRYIEEFTTNILLYAFWIFVALTGVDFLRQLRRERGK